MKGILGEKLGMMQIWDDEGRQVGVTAVRVGPCPVVQVKTVEKDGYSAVQIGYREAKSKALTRPELGHQKAVTEKTGKNYSHLYELRDYQNETEVGEMIDCSIFDAGEKVNVRSVSKGKGFQGVVKRYNFGGGRETHGSTFHRSTGAIGAGTYPGRVIKGKKLPGRMGGRTSTITNLEVVKVLADENIMLLKGSVPGAKGSKVLVYRK